MLCLNVMLFFVQLQQLTPPPSNFLFGWYGHTWLVWLVPLLFCQSLLVASYCISDPAKANWDRVVSGQGCVDTCIVYILPLVWEHYRMPQTALFFMEYSNCQRSALSSAQYCPVSSCHFLHLASPYACAPRQRFENAAKNVT